MRRLTLAFLACTVTFVACRDEPLPTAPSTERALSVIATSQSVGTPGFYFLPPLAEQPTVTGQFDAEANPRVVICEWTGSSCGVTVAEFDSDGQGSERVRANGSDGHYIVNWHTGDSGLQGGSVYRISVTMEGVELGFIDAMAEGKGKGSKGSKGAPPVDDEYFDLKIGRTVPIKFRIEVGAFDPPTAALVGVITSTSGSPLSGVEASLEGTAVVGTTNSAGGLSLDGVRTGRTAVLRLSLTGFVDQLVQLEVPNGAVQVTFRTSMIERAASVVVSASSGGTATSTDGAGVVLPPSALVDASGNPVSGSVDVTITPVDVSGDAIGAFPGSFTGINSSGESGLLMTYGVAEYTFEQSGEPLQLAPGATATVIIPIYTGDAGLSVGDQIPLWYLDESTGDWIEESLGDVVALVSSPTGLGLEADVSHFSWWNIDVWVSAPYEPVVRCVVDAAPTSCTVRATVDDPSFPRTNAEYFLPVGGARLTFPPLPTVTQLSGESSNRYGFVSGGVSGPSGGGAADTVWVDLVNTGVLSGDHSVVSVTPSFVEIPASAALLLEARDETGAPMGEGGASVYFWLLDSGGGVVSSSWAIDNGDGTYSLDLVPPGAGSFTVRGFVNNVSVGTGDPTLTAAYSPTAGRGSTSLLSTSAASVPVGGTATFTVQAYDIGGFPKGTGGDVVSLSVSTGALAAEGTVGPTTDNGDGTYSATFTGTNAGAPTPISASINFEAIPSSLTIAVSPGVLTEAEADAELAAAFAEWWRTVGGLYGEWMLATMADVTTSSWGNGGMRDMSSEPRQAWNNDPTYSYQSVTLNSWNRSYSAISRAYDVLTSLDTGLQMGVGGVDNDRTRAAAKLVQGLAHAQLALIFDKAFTLDENTDVSTATLTLQPYDAVMDSALVYLAEAIAIADASSFTLPATWIQGTSLSSGDLSQLAHSYSARFMSAVARTPAERASADWSAIQTHVSQGVTSDFAPVSDGNVWLDYFKGYSHNPVWMRADMRLVGGVAPNDPETDPTGDFAAWLATPVADRLPYTSNTADLRIWDGTLDGGCCDPNPGTYFAWDQNIAFRPDRGTYHFSYYTFQRFPSTYGLNPGDAMYAVSTVEMDLLQAEARIRLGQPGAAALINQTRVVNGGLSAATDADANLFDKLAYEKRLETYHLSGGLPYFDRRGWGSPVPPTGFGQGVVEGTPFHFPVPGRELDRLGLPNYTFGGAGPAMVAGGFANQTVPASSIYRRVEEATRVQDPVLDETSPVVSTRTGPIRR